MLIQCYSYRSVFRADLLELDNLSRWSSSLRTKYFPLTTISFTCNSSPTPKALCDSVSKLLYQLVLSFAGHIQETILLKVCCSGFLCHVQKMLSHIRSLSPLTLTIIFPFFYMSSVLWLQGYTGNAICLTLCISQQAFQPLAISFISATQRTSLRRGKIYAQICV